MSCNSPARRVFCLPDELRVCHFVVCYVIRSCLAFSFPFITKLQQAQDGQLGAVSSNPTPQSSCSPVPQFLHPGFPQRCPLLSTEHPETSAPFGGTVSLNIYHLRTSWEELHCLPAPAPGHSPRVRLLSE